MLPIHIFPQAPGPYLYLSQIMLMKNLVDSSRHWHRQCQSALEIPPPCTRPLMEFAMWATATAQYCTRLVMWTLPSVQDTRKIFPGNHEIHGPAQDCGNSRASALDSPQSCAQPFQSAPLMTSCSKCFNKSKFGNRLVHKCKTDASLLHTH